MTVAQLLSIGRLQGHQISEIRQAGIQGEAHTCTYTGASSAAICTRLKPSQEIVTEIMAVTLERFTAVIRLQGQGQGGRGRGAGAEGQGQGQL